MTSRIHDCKRYSLDANKALEGLVDKDSKELLLKAADIPKDLWPSYNDQAEKVVYLLGSHTLALIQAGAYIAKGHCQLYEYPKVYERQRERLLKYRPEQAQSRYHDVYATFEASAEVLEQSKSEAAKDALYLLTVLSMLDSAVIPLQIFQSAWNSGREILLSSCEEICAIDAMSRSHALRLPGLLVEESDEWDPFRLTEASSKLVSLSLAIRHDINGSMGLSMHPLTHAWAKDRQDLEQQDVAWIATGCVLALSRSDSIMWQTQERRLLPHLQSYLNIKIGRILLFESKALVIPILLQCGWALSHMRQDSRLSHLLEDIFTELRKNPKEPLEELLPLYLLQARSLGNTGKNKMAVALLEQVIEIEGRTLAETHPDRLASQHELAIIYKANGQVKEAIALLEQVIEIRGNLAETHPDRLASQHELATAYNANRQVKEAIVMLEQVVEIEGRTLAETHPDQLASQHELAIAYEANGQVKEAIVLLEQVVEIKGRILAETHPDRLASQHALAIAYKANGQVKEAIALLEQVVEIKGRTLAETHPDQLASQHELAIAYEANGQVKEAIVLLEQVVEIEGRTLAETHPGRLASQYALAIVYEANGQVEEAIVLLEQVVEIEGRTLAETHPSRLASQYALAIVYEANGQVEEAVALGLRRLD
jgi:tetratricopeptide (TPR) repeat protein